MKRERTSYQIDSSALASMQLTWQTARGHCQTWQVCSQTGMKRSGPSFTKQAELGLEDIFIDRLDALLGNG